MWVRWKWELKAMLWWSRLRGRGSLGKTGEGEMGAVAPGTEKESNQCSRCSTSCGHGTGLWCASRQHGTAGTRAPGCASVRWSTRLEGSHCGQQWGPQPYLESQHSGDVPSSANAAQCPKGSHIPVCVPPADQIRRTIADFYTQKLTLWWLPCLFIFYNHPCLECRYHTTHKSSESAQLITARSVKRR